MTSPRVTLPRAVARGLQTTPFRHVAPAPHAAPQTETSSPVGSVIQVSGRARARTLPQIPAMAQPVNSLVDAQPVRPLLRLVHIAAQRPREIGRASCRERV